MTHHASAMVAEAPSANRVTSTATAEPLPTPATCDAVPEAGVTTPRADNALEEGTGSAAASNMESVLCPAIAHPTSDGAAEQSAGDVDGGDTPSLPPSMGRRMTTAELAAEGLG